MLWDWMWYSGLYGSSYFDLGYYAWRYPNYYGGYFGGGGDVSGAPAGPQVLTKISKNQLQKPGNPPFAMPKELKGAYKSLLQAVQSGDEGARASLQAISRHAVVAGAADLNAPRIHDRAVKLEAVLQMARALPSHDPQGVLLKLPPLSSQNSLNSALRSYDRSARIAELRNRVISSLTRAGTERQSLTPPRALPPSRIHDWNPDARIARQLGVDIMYFSRLNQVYCPQLNISSSMVHSRPALTSGGLAGHLDGGSSGSGGSAHSGSSSGGSVSTSGASGSSSGGSSSSGGGGGGHIRN
jgi:hypothetical protein